MIEAVAEHSTRLIVYVASGLTVTPLLRRRIFGKDKCSQTLSSADLHSDSD